MKHKQNLAGTQNTDQSERRFPEKSSGDILQLKRQKSPGAKPFVYWIVMVCAGMLALITFVSLAAVSIYAYYEFGQWIAPGTYFENLDLSGKTASEARFELERTWSQVSVINASNGIQNISISPVEIGINLDSIATSKKAQQIGRHGTATFRIVEMAAGLFSSRQIEPTYILDVNQASIGIEKLRPSMSQPPKNASFYAADGGLFIAASEIGYTINREDTLRYLQDNYEQVLDTGVLPVMMKPVLPEITNISTLLQEAQQILDQPAAINVFDPIENEQKTFQIPRNELVSWIEVKLIDQEPMITFNETMIADFLDRLSIELNQDRFIQGEDYSHELANALQGGSLPTIVLKYPAARYHVQSGDTLLKIGWKLGIPYWMIVNVNPGIDSDHLLAGSELIIPSKTDLLTIPVIPEKRIIIQLKAQRLIVMQNYEQIKSFVISTGVDRSPTQPGIFQIQTHVDNAYASVWDLYMPDFLGIYEAWPGFMNGIHGLPMLSGGRRMWANSLGRPASYGCIILGLNEADWLYHWAENGVVVEIKE